MNIPGFTITIKRKDTMSLDTSYTGKAFPREQVTLTTDMVSSLHDTVSRLVPGLDTVTYAPIFLTLGNMLLFHSTDKLWPTLAEIGINAERMLHTRESYEYHEPLFAGDIIDVELCMEDMYESELFKKVTVRVDFFRQNTLCQVMRLELLEPGAENG
jgi:hypothetical protein